MMTVQRTAPSVSTCTRPLPLGSAIPLATGPQKKQKVNIFSLSLAVNPPDRDEILLGNEKGVCLFVCFLLVSDLSPFWGGSLGQEGLLGAWEITTSWLWANTPILTAVIAQKGVNERYWSKGGSFH